MSKTSNKEYTSNDLILQLIKAKPKSKINLEQKDSESLNTMDYYKEDSSNKNSLIEEIKLNTNKLLFNAKKPEKIQINLTEENRFNSTLNKTNRNNHKSSNAIRTLSDLNTQKTQNGQKRPNHIAKVCCKYYSINNLSNKTCIKCKKHFCINCFKGNLNINLDNNNDDINNCDKNLNSEKICHFCKKKEFKNKNFNTMKEQNKKINVQIGLEPLDNDSETATKKTFWTEKNISKTDNNNNKSKENFKYLQDQYKEYEFFMKQIDNRKKEIQIKKDISLNILQMIKKAIEFEYEKYMTKLNEFVSRLNKIKSSINEKMNKNYTNEIELKINIDTNKNSLNNLFKNYENYSNKVISRPLFRGYKIYESNNILINYADTYYMKNKEVFSDLPIGKVYIKIERFTNNYINYLDFSTLIKQNEKNNTDDSINCSFQSASSIINKPRFIVNMIVDNKLIRLNKTNKDTNDMSLSYESYEEENKILFQKNKNYNSGKVKKDNFNIKVIISEIML